VKKKHGHNDHEEHADESWLLPYSDLMTLLLALFIVLYAASAVNTSKLEQLSKAFNSVFNNGFGLLDHSSITEDQQVNKRTDDTQNRRDDGTKRLELMKQEEQNLEKVKKQLDEYIKKNGLSSSLETQLNQSQLMITIRDNALFLPASASIKPDARKLAVAIGQMLQQYPDYEVLVTGHTDNVPINTEEFPSNWELSSKRAINFMRILLENKAFDPKRFSATGYGEYHPVDTNDSAEGRARNRRVEVSILRKYTDKSVEGSSIAVVDDAVAAANKNATDKASN